MVNRHIDYNIPRVDAKFSSALEAHGGAARWTLTEEAGFSLDELLQVESFFCFEYEV